MYQFYEEVLRASLKFICVTFILFNFVTSQFDEKNSRYLGCFLEENMDSENKLENYSTKKDCANYCFENDYPFAAVYKSACRCSRKYVSKLMKEIDENCINNNCFKNSSCLNFFQMYTTGMSDTNSFPREIYLGCLQERVGDDDNRLLKTFLNHYSDNSPQKCSEECFKNGYLYSGLTNGYILGTACWCGDQYPWVRHKIKESSCNQACSGDKSKKCGDYWKLSVYSTGLINYPKQHTIGCFNKDVYNMTSKIIVPFQKECHSSSRCSHICIAKKFKYAALSENHCECSNENPDHAKQKNNCVKCNYDTTENCGSEESLNIYENIWLNLIKENISEKYLGCYENSWMYPIMDGWNITITNGQNYDTIRQSCVASCFAKGFPYVAIMMSLKICTCSFVKPSIDAKVERHVKEPCHNSSTRYSVFATGVTSHDLTGNHYIGCYEENHLQKIFDQETVNEFHISNTPEICSKYCYQNNFYYFGILSRKTCLCGNKSININEFPRLVDSKCNMQCPGDANKYCGGNKKIAAFVIGKDWVKLHNCLPNCECVLLSQYNTTVVDCSHGNLNNTVEINSMFANTSSLEMYLKYNIFQELPKLSSFNILTLDISNNVLDKLNGKHLPKNLKVLKLHNNKLQYFDKSTLIYLSSLDELTLSNNSWDCSCKFLDMFDFMINHRSIISDIDIVTCQTMSIPIVSMTKNNICPKTEWLYFYITIALVFIIFICFLCVRFDLHKKVLLRCSKFQNFDNILFQQTTDTETSETLMRMINYDELVTATDNWNKDRILGEGGFGVVYKGNWINTDVAIKRLKTKGVAEKVINMHTLGNKIQSSSREIMYLNAIKHDNILSMYGFTIHDSESCLIYQFMANGSLEDRLQCKDDSKPLNWPMRENIAIGSARGIQFMHNMNIPLIHGDIKSANILLDSNFEPRIGDFGLARVGAQMKEEEGQLSGIEVSHVYGTMPYLPEDFRKTKKLSTKVDTYSFGVVLFEIATGLRSFSRSPSYRYLKDFVLSKFQAGKIHTIIDKKAGSDTHKSFELLVVLGKACVVDLASNRPDMALIYKKLCNDTMKPENNIITKDITEIDMDIEMQKNQIFINDQEGNGNQNINEKAVKLHKIKAALIAPLNDIPSITDLYSTTQKSIHGERQAKTINLPDDTENIWDEYFFTTDF